ncbi:MAG: transglycosylase SLT domain-containing protein [Nitrospiraceae bacterium]
MALTVPLLGFVAVAYAATESPVQQAAQNQTAAPASQSNGGVDTEASRTGASASGESASSSDSHTPYIDRAIADLPPATSDQDTASSATSSDSRAEASQPTEQASSSDDTKTDAPVAASDAQTETAPNAEATSPFPDATPMPPAALQTLTAEPPAPVVAKAAPKQPEPYNVPIMMDAKVEGHIRFFNTTIHDKFEKWLHRLNHYHPIVERIFLEFGLPTDLVYLSLVESGFNPHAYSRARATGPWQFMKGTGLVYGLRVDRFVDERRDPVKSTVAAARYLRDLYDLFGSWPLAMAAYNAGEGKVMRALAKSQSESFSEIAETRHIRRETKEYVPRFMAATVIAKNPAQYGFNIQAVDPHEFEEVVVNRSLHLRSISAASGVSFDQLRLLNPELRLDATPPDDPQYHLKVPVGSRAKIESVLDRVPVWKAPPAPRVVKVKSTPPSPRKWYRVRSGDTLASIAKRFHMSPSALKDRNNLSSGQVRKGDLLSIR